MDTEMPKTTSLKAEQGSTLIEFAPVLLILLMLTFGMIDLGRYIYAISSVHAAAQEGARAGLVNFSEAKPVAESMLVALDVSKATVVPSQDEETVVVDITYQFEFITPLLAAATNGPIEINSRASDAIY
jgi:TadE-like protein